MKERLGLAEGQSGEKTHGDGDFQGHGVRGRVSSARLGADTPGLEGCGEASSTTIAKSKWGSREEEPWQLV